MLFILIVGADFFISLSVQVLIDLMLTGKDYREEGWSCFFTEILKLAVVNKWQQQCCCYNVTALCCSIIRILFDDNCLFSDPSIQPTEPFRQQPASCCIHHIFPQPLSLLLQEIINVKTLSALSVVLKIKQRKKTESTGVFRVDIVLIL